MQKERRSLPYRLAIDLGSTSLGWAVLELDREGNPSGVRRMGVRIFTDGRNPKDKTSLAVGRRIARQMRRRRDRMLRRRTRLLALLVRLGLMPGERVERKALEVLDPYDLRARGLLEPLTAFEFGRALFHLNQRRGFHANRRAGSKDEDKGKIREGIGLLAKELDERGLTLGAFLAWRKAEGYGVRARLKGEGKTSHYPLYPGREMVKAEFEALWNAQRAHHPTLLTEEARAQIERRVFHQRPLKPAQVGKCSLFPEDERAPRALPSAQSFRLLVELANLRIITRERVERPLTLAERDRILAEVGRKAPRTLTFKRIRQLLKLESDTGFSLESERRAEILADETGYALKAVMGPRWLALTLAEQDEVVERLLGEADEGALIDDLVARFALEPETAARMADLALPDFHLKIGRRALGQLLPVLATQAVEENGVLRPIRYDEAVAAIGLHHSDRRPGALLDTLPYYALVLERHVAFGTGEPTHDQERRLGRIANPTVHIALNQLRHVVNALIARYGRPSEVVVELARDLKLSREERRQRDASYAENQRNNDARKALLAEMKESETVRNLLKLRLWEEQGPAHDRRCPYTGQQISLNLLLSREVDIDHILPFSRSLDDSAANKVVCIARANRDKTNKTPFEAFGPNEAQWREIQARAESLPKNKRWRFAADAMARFEAEGGFEARQLNDTRYLSRLAREYLERVAPKVRVSPGRLTALLRRRWGLDSILADHNRAPGDPAGLAPKNRDDHRHHAIDAAVIGCVDQSMVQRVQTLRAREEERGLHRFLQELPEPFPGFRDQVAERTRAIIVSHRPEHGTGGRLHEDTAYGPVKDPEKEDGCNLVFRKALSGLSAKEVGRIRARDLRKILGERLAAHRVQGLNHAQAMARAAEDVGAMDAWANIRHVRLLQKEAAPIAIADAGGAPYKLLIAGEIHHIDLFAGADGRWSGRAVTLFDARRTARPDGRAGPPQLEPGERFVMRLHKGDMVKLERDGVERVMRVRGLEPVAGRIRLAPDNAAGDLQKRHDDPDDPFRWLYISYDVLRRQRARSVTVDVLGRLGDRGFRASKVPVEVPAEVAK